jgi:hypothetical protein
LLLAAASLPVSAWAAAGGVINPGQSYPGARLLQRMNPAGMPEMRPDTFGPMTLFVFPIAVAATGMDLYIADAGLGALFRYDPSLDSMAAIPGVRITQQSRIAALPDGSVVVANGSAAPARRFARGGRAMQGIDPQLGAAFMTRLSETRIVVDFTGWIAFKAGLKNSCRMAAGQPCCHRGWFRIYRNRWPWITGAYTSPAAAVAVL